jgi:hypothetical protein
MAWRSIKCLIPGTGRLFRHLGMQKVSFQRPEKFLAMGNVNKILGGGKNFLGSAAAFSILGNGIFWWKAKTKRLFSQCMYVYMCIYVVLFFLRLVNKH